MVAAAAAAALCSADSTSQGPSFPAPVGADTTTYGNLDSALFLPSGHLHCLVVTPHSPWSVF